MQVKEVIYMFSITEKDIRAAVEEMKDTEMEKFLIQEPHASTSSSDMHVSVSVRSGSSPGHRHVSIGFDVPLGTDRSQHVSIGIDIRSARSHRSPRTDPMSTSPMRTRPPRSHRTGPRRSHRSP
jgi:hypothetical protein